MSIPNYTRKQAQARLALCLAQKPDTTHIPFYWTPGSLPLMHLQAFEGLQGWYCLVGNTGYPISIESNAPWRQNLEIHYKSYPIKAHDSCIHELYLAIEATQPDLFKLLSTSLQEAILKQWYEMIPSDINRYLEYLLTKMHFLSDQILDKTCSEKDRKTLYAMVHRMAWHRDWMKVLDKKANADPEKTTISLQASWPEIGIEPNVTIHSYTIEWTPSCTQAQEASARNRRGSSPYYPFVSCPMTPLYNSTKQGTNNPERKSFDLNASHTQSSKIYHPE